MAVPVKPTREELNELTDNLRVIKAFEQLFNIVPSETDDLSGNIEEVRFEAGQANARAQQAIDGLPEEKNYGVFYDTTDQAAAAIDTPKAATLNTTQVSSGVSVSGSQISVVKKGLYEFEFRVQL